MNNELRNTNVVKKLFILDQHKNEISCEYTKMVLEKVKLILQKRFTNDFIEQFNKDTYNDSLDQYFIDSFVEDFTSLTNGIIEEIAKKISK